ncbi:response regulator transcription factor, partial [bacterium]|nr:response regulator transcription factor [bacterium]
MIRILLADNQPIMRFALKTILEQQEDFCLVGEVIDVTEIIYLCSEFSPNLLLIDVELLGENCELTLNELSEQFPALKIVIFSAMNDVNTVRNVVGSRIDGYILKDEPPETL